MTRVSPSKPLKRSSFNKKTIASKLASVTELLKSITTGRSSEGEKFDSIESTTPDGMEVPRKGKEFSTGFFLTRILSLFSKRNPVNLYLDEGQQGNTPQRSDAARDASAASTVEAAISIGSESPRQGTWVLPGTIKDIDNSDCVIGDYLDNIHDSWFGDPHKSSDNGADSRESILHPVKK